MCIGHNGAYVTWCRQNMSILNYTHLRHIKWNLNVTHGTQVVNLIRLDVGNDGNKIGSITQVTIVKEKLNASLVAVTVDVVDTTSVEGGWTTDDAVDLLLNWKEGGGIVQGSNMSNYWYNKNEIEIEQPLRFFNKKITSHSATVDILASPPETGSKQNQLINHINVIVGVVVDS